MSQPTAPTIEQQALEIAAICCLDLAQLPPRPPTLCPRHELRTVVAGIRREAHAVPRC